MTGQDLVEMLHRDYVRDEANPGGIFAAEIAAPGPDARRADVIWAPLTAAGGAELVGHEIKVSRRDLAAELADPTKSHPWQRVCDRWWLVVPDLALIDGMDLPDTWGVLTPPAGPRRRAMTVAQAAPPLAPDDQRPALRTLAARVHWAHQRATAELAAVRTSRDDAEQRARDAEQRARDAEQRARDAGTRRSAPAAGDAGRGLREQIVGEIVDALGGPHPGTGAAVGGWDCPVAVDITHLAGAGGTIAGDLTTTHDPARHHAPGAMAHRLADAAHDTAAR